MPRAAQPSQPAIAAAALPAEYTRLPPAAAALPPRQRGAAMTKGPRSAAGGKAAPRPGAQKQAAPRRPARKNSPRPARFSVQWQAWPPRRAGARRQEGSTRPEAGPAGRQRSLAAPQPARDCRGPGQGLASAKTDRSEGSLMHPENDREPFHYSNKLREFLAGSGGALPPRAVAGRPRRGRAGLPHRRHRRLQQARQGN